MSLNEGVCSPALPFEAPPKAPPTAIRFFACARSQPAIAAMACASWDVLRRRRDAFSLVTNASEAAQFVGLQAIDDRASTASHLADEILDQEKEDNKSKNYKNPEHRCVVPNGLLPNWLASRWLWWQRPRNRSRCVLLYD